MSKPCRATLLLAALPSIALAACGCSRRESGGAAPAPPPRAIPPEPPRPVPEALAPRYREIQRLQEAGNFAAVAGRYPAFLGELERHWGAGAAPLAPYYYNYALALKLGGLRGEHQEAVREGRRRWPDSLELKLLELTARADIALERRAYDPAAEALFRDVLRSEVEPRVRGLRVETGKLHAQWAEMLFQAQRLKEARAVAEEGLRSSPGHRLLERLRARVLLSLGENREALPLLESLVREEPSPELELQLGIALLDAGQASAAWERFSRLLPRRDATEAGRQIDDALGKRLALEAARALAELGRHEEAREHLLAFLAADPLHTRGLAALAASLRKLGAAEAARAVEARLRRLLPRERFQRLASQARAAGRESSVLYYQALAALAVDQCGQALDLLQQALKLSPAIAILHLERCRVLALLGRCDLAEHAAAEGSSRAASAVFPLERARLCARLARREEAEGLLASSSQPGPPPPGPDEARDWRQLAAALLVSRRTLACLELGNLQKAEEVLAADGPRAENAEEITLCRAEAALAAGRPEEARPLLSGSFEEVPGGAEWARALSIILEIRSDGGLDDKALARFDPSDLLDQPRLLGERHPRPPPGASPPAAAWLERAAAAHARREAILASMRGRADADLIPRWLELLALYREAGAARKARELAWYLLGLRPHRAEEHRRLAEVLDSPEEVVERLAAAEAGLRRDRGDEELQRLRAGALLFLGVKPR